MADSPAAAAPGQGAPVAGAQPPAGGQGGATGQPTAQGQGDGQFNWGLFPDVPEASRELLEPHLRNVQGHVTRMQQQTAPYQSLMQAVQPNQVENIVGFLNQYSADPVATVMGMVQQMQQDGSITVEQLQQITGEQQNGAAPETQAQPGQEEVPAWAQQLQQRLGQFDQQQQQQQQAQQEAEEAATLETAKTSIRGQLDIGGIPADVVTDEMIVAAIIANDGDEQLAANMFSQLRDGLLGNFTNGKTTPAAQPKVQGELPKTPKPGGRKKGDGFDEARVGAAQYLEQQGRMAAQA